MALARRAKLCGKPSMRAERHELHRLFPPVVAQDLAHRTRRIIVAQQRLWAVGAQSAHRHRVAGESPLRSQPPPRLPLRISCTSKAEPSVGFQDDVGSPQRVLCSARLSAFSVMGHRYWIAQKMSSEAMNLRAWSRGSAVRPNRPALVQRFSTATNRAPRRDRPGRSA
jgi:hypothetical protein